MSNEKAILAKVDVVIERSFNHLTPGTPDYGYMQQFKADLRAELGITPDAEPKPIVKVEKVN